MWHSIKIAYTDTHTGRKFCDYEKVEKLVTDLENQIIKERQACNDIMNIYRSKRKALRQERYEAKAALKRLRKAYARLRAYMFGTDAKLRKSAGLDATYALQQEHFWNNVRDYLEHESIRKTIWSFVTMATSRMAGVNLLESEDKNDK